VVERAAVNRDVPGSNPGGGVILLVSTQNKEKKMTKDQFRAIIEQDNKDIKVALERAKKKIADFEAQYEQRCGEMKKAELDGSREDEELGAKNAIAVILFREKFNDVYTLLSSQLTSAEVRKSIAMRAEDAPAPEVRKPSPYTN
jgi:hypothetical protein